MSRDFFVRLSGVLVLLLLAVQAVQSAHAGQPFEVAACATFAWFVIVRLSNA